jgi:mannose-6-phosphate isomerase-like protein (cupin superfamily)
MEIKSLADATRFDAAKLAKNLLVDSAHMVCDLYCLEPGQAQRVHAHEDSDKVYVVLDGTATLTVGAQTQVVGPGHAVVARAGEAQGIRNDSTGRVTALVVMAPKP